MILSHRYKFIFLKTIKAAGTSIEIALSKYCDANAIITPISDEDEKTRRHLGYPGPQNYQSPICDYKMRDIFKLLTRGKRKARFYNHISAKDVRTLIGEQLWDSFFKFCVVRNPWDRVISLYYWLHKSEPRPSISEFIQSKKLLRLKHRGFDLYSLDGHIAVDKVCRFERLEDDLEEVRIQLGIPEILVLPRVKSKYRKDRRSYVSILGEEDKNIIAELFSDEIALFGYEF